VAPRRSRAWRVCSTASSAKAPPHAAAAARQDEDGRAARVAATANAAFARIEATSYTVAVAAPRVHLITAEFRHMPLPLPLLPFAEIRQLF